MHRKILISLIGCFVFIVLGIVAFKWLILFSKKESKLKDPTESNVVYVKVKSVYPMQDRVSIKGYGTLHPRVEVAISAEVSGKIVYRHPYFESGGVCTKGSTLFVIDQEPYRIQLLKAEANLASALAQQNLLETEIKGFQRSCEVSSEAVELARREMLRFERLARDEATSKSQLDKVQNSFQTALAALVRDENNLKQALIKRAVNKAAIAQAEAALQEAKLNLAKTEVIASFTCCVEKRNVEVGDYVTVGKVLGVIYDPSTFEARVPIPSIDLPWLIDAEVASEKVSRCWGNEAIVTLRSSYGLVKPLIWKGEISRLSSSVNEKTRTVEAAIKIPGNFVDNTNCDVFLLKGAFVEATIFGKKFEDLFRIPRGWISREDTVNIYTNGKLEIRPVEIIRFEDDYAYVTKGLASGDLVITSPLPIIVDGMPLKIIEKDG